MPGNWSVATSDPVAVLWAKSASAGTWHPLAAHMVDAALVARRLWESWLAPATRRWLAAPFADDEAGAAYLSWLAGCHDLGKASPAFHVQVAWLAEQVRAVGLALPDVLPERSRAPHAKVSAVAIGPLLQERYGWERARTFGPAAIIGGHHGWFPEECFAQEGRKRPSLYGWEADPAGPWMAARAALFDLVVAVTGAEEVLRTAGSVDLGRPRELALAGYVVLADWLASNVDLFPLTSAPFESAYVAISAGRAQRALDTVGWHRWDPAPGGFEFQGRFGFSPNTLQSAALTAAAESVTPGLMIMEAPMGHGKTEAALATVEMWSERHGLSGTFLGLPTQATTNQMFSRVRRWLERMGAGTYLLELAHGKAAHVTEYHELSATLSCIDMDEGSAAHVTAEAWFHGPKRRLLAPFVVGTIDQALLCAAKVKHVALRQVGLLGKVVVIDEVHAYDAYMSVFLRRALRWLGAAGVPVILLSGTLPPAARKRLVGAYVGQPTELPDPVYPAITHVSPEGNVSTAAVEPEQHVVSVQIEVLDEAATVPNGAPVVDVVARMGAQGANVLVVRNTVTRAQATASALTQVLGPDAVTLLHARFTAGDRIDKEQWLAACFGPGGDRPAGHVVVGTQVLEQSLDVDFDVLVTDLAPIDLVLQRMGRIHRHPGVRRPDGFERPRVVVTGVDRITGGPPLFPSGSVWIYKEHLLLRTAAVLMGREAIALPDDLPTLVAQVYGEADVAPFAWAERATEAATEWQRALATAEATAQQLAIPPPEGAPNLLELCRIGIGDPDDDSPAVLAAVRDAPATVEVVVGWETDETDRVACSGGTVPVARRPVPEEVDLALRSTLRLPPWLTAAATGLERPPGWQDHPWLRGLALLRVDRAGVAPIGNNEARYSQALGLEVTSGGGGASLRSR